MTRFSLWVTAYPRLARCLLAGPGAVAAGLMTTYGMPVWWPSGIAGVNHLIWPLILGPLVWALFLLYGIVEENIERGFAVCGGVVALNGVLVGIALI